MTVGARHGPLGYLTIWPTGENQPVVSTMNSLDGRIKANAAIVPAGYQGAVSVYVTNTTNVVLDIDGYFAPAAADAAVLSADAVPGGRHPQCQLPAGSGRTVPVGGEQRDFPVLESSVQHSQRLPQAYSLNFTAVPYPAVIRWAI